MEEKQKKKNTYNKLVIDKISNLIDKRIEKHNGIKFIRSDNYYDLEKYQFDTKLNILNEKLLEVINVERN